MALWLDLSVQQSIPWQKIIVTNLSQLMCAVARWLNMNCVIRQMEFMLTVLLEYLLVIHHLTIDHHFGAQVYHLCWLQCCHPHPHSSWGGADCGKFYDKYCILIIWCTGSHVISRIICNKHTVPSYRVWLACMIRRQGKEYLGGQGNVS